VNGKEDPGLQSLLEHNDLFTADCNPPADGLPQARDGIGTGVRGESMEQRGLRPPSCPLDSFLGAPETALYSSKVVRSGVSDTRITYAVAQGPHSPRAPIYPLNQ
jgi:hypothetical protein